MTVYYSFDCRNFLKSIVINIQSIYSVFLTLNLGQKYARTKVRRRISISTYWISWWPILSYGKMKTKTRFNFENRNKCKQTGCLIFLPSPQRYHKKTKQTTCLLLRSVTGPSFTWTLKCGLRRHTSVRLLCARVAPSGKTLFYKGWSGWKQQQIIKTIKKGNMRVQEIPISG